MCARSDMARDIPYVSETDHVLQPEALQAAADRCVKELGGIDFVM